MIIKRIWAVYLALSFSALSVCAATTSGKPHLSAESAILIEADTGEVIFELESRKRLPMASTTKIMTALVALENGELDEPFSVPREATGLEGSSVYLVEGETVTLRDLLYALMLESANDAAAAIALRVGGSDEAFSALMNEKAYELGLNDTHFTNPHGLDDPDHYTTAFDLCRLTCAAMKNEEFAKIVSTRSADAFTRGNARKLVNHNKLLNSLNGAVGVKTGFTKNSGRCLVSAVRRNGILTVAVTLNDPNDWIDHKALHEYGQTEYERNILTEPGSVRVDIPVIGGIRTSVRCSSSDTLTVVLKTGLNAKLTVEAPRFVPAPVKRGDALAKAVFTVEGKEVGSVPLYAESDVEEKAEKRTFFDKLLEFFGRTAG